MNEELIALSRKIEAVTLIYVQQTRLVGRKLRHLKRVCMQQRNFPYIIPGDCTPRDTHYQLAVSS